MKNILFFSLLFSAGVYGMNEDDRLFNAFAAWKLGKSLDELEELQKISDAEISDITHKEFDNRRNYVASCNGDTISVNHVTSGPMAGKYSACRWVEGRTEIILDPAMYHRLEKLYKERNSSQAKQVASTSSVDSDAVSFLIEDVD